MRYLKGLEGAFEKEERGFRLEDVSKLYTQSEVDRLIREAVEKEVN